MNNEQLTMPARHPTYRPTAVCSRFTAHRSLAEIYAFSAKEREVETGLSYFGARYYSSELSIWLSVDPMADKYPSLSPYTYCANNPVKLVDPNGEEIVISESVDDQGNKVVNIKFTATLVNKSSKEISKEDMEIYRNDIINGIKDTYSGKLEDGTCLNVDVDIDILDKGELQNPLTTRHTINIVDRFENIDHAGEAEIGGGTMWIRLDVCKGNLPGNPLERTASHEFGHLLGLDHENVDFPESNIMNPNTNGRNISSAQVKESCKMYYKGQLNNNIYGIQRREEWRRHALKK